MGMASGTQPLAFGHNSDAAVDIEGLAVELFLPVTVRFTQLHAALGRPPTKAS